MVLISSSIFCQVCAFLSYHMKHSLVCFCLVVSSGFLQARTASTASGTGIGVLDAAFYSGLIRRIASEWPWLTPLPQKV